ncbi:hypothetical protein D046_3341, partial [Vibrio parahaemolyticus V-223/04]
LVKKYAFDELKWLPEDARRK